MVVEDQQVFLGLAFEYPIDSCKEVGLGGIVWQTNLLDTEVRDLSERGLDQTAGVLVDGFTVIVAECWPWLGCIDDDDSSAVVGLHVVLVEVVRVRLWRFDIVKLGGFAVVVGFSRLLRGPTIA